MTYQTKREIAIKYVKFDVTSNHRWTERATCLLEAGKRVKYAFENICTDGEIKCWVPLKYFFDTLVTPVNNRRNQCATHCLDTGKSAYYAFENRCNGGNFECMVFKKCLIDTLLAFVLLYGVDVWGGSIPNSTKETRNVKKQFHMKFLQTKHKHHTRFYFLRPDHFQLRS